MFCIAQVTFMSITRDSVPNKRCDTAAIYCVNSMKPGTKAPSFLVVKQPLAYVKGLSNLPVHLLPTTIV